MQLNNLVFPAPRSSYSSASFPREIIWIPRPAGSKTEKDSSVPCLMLKSKRPSSKILIYFHGNAEDIGMTYEINDLIRNTLDVNVIVPEYPGYGVYKGKISAGRLVKDALIVFWFVREVLGFDNLDILVLGRSVGSGPACFLAKEMRIAALFLVSAFTSIKDVVKELVGKMAKVLVAERFRNIDCMPLIYCPCLFIHGIMDTMIPFRHSQELHAACAGPCFIVLNKKMDHDNFDYYDDLLIPIAKFIESSQISLCSPKSDLVVIDPRFYCEPK